jgi:hypothetical protein
VCPFSLLLSKYLSIYTHFRTTLYRHNLLSANLFSPPKIALGNTHIAADIDLGEVFEDKKE